MRNARLRSLDQLHFTLFQVYTMRKDRLVRQQAEVVVHWMSVTRLMRVRTLTELNLTHLAYSCQRRGKVAW